ncbi:MAG: phage/plasmid primase, P4 family [Selenomonas sp.]|jgi:P4 family phage/plasmid primase-like protien|nr:phage/plasmid primase, P4 family [Selenomonas sp.]
MKFTLYTADCRGNEKNTSYPHACRIGNVAEFRAAVAFDHVAAAYQNGRRSVGKFQSADMLVMDCDNDHSDVPAEWVTPENLEELLTGVNYVLASSRHNGMVKDGKSPRPRFHVYFPHEAIQDAAEYAGLKRAIQARFPFFDSNALDAARFIYGHPCEKAVWHEGGESIEQLIMVPTAADSIPQGQRNSTLSHFAGKLVKRYGVTDRAHEIFLEKAMKCEPPLEDEELAKIWYSAEQFAKKVQSQSDYVPPAEYEFSHTSLKPADYSDIGQAKVLAREYRDELKYTPATDYLHYDGVTWNESKAQAIGTMEEFLDLQLADAEDAVKTAFQEMVDRGVAKEKLAKGGRSLEKEITTKQSKAYARYQAAMAYQAFVQKRRDMKYVLSALQAARPMLEIQVADLDHDAFLLNTPDGAYDLRLGLAGRKMHDPSDYATKVTTVAPGEQGEKIWQDAIGTFFCGDLELMEYVQQIVGLAAVGKVYVESLIIAYGDGRNGKSTFWNTIARVLGTYSGNISADTLTMGCKRNVKPELAEAKGKRMLIAAELDEGMRLNTSLIKQLCSTDAVQAEKKYKDPFHFTPSHTLVLYTNHLPRVGANDPGTWRRLLVIPFDAVIEGGSDIKNYADYLFEQAGPAVLSWVIGGAQKVIERGFRLERPFSVEQAIDAYRDNNDWLGHFLEDCCLLDKTYHEKSGVLYNAYRAFASSTGEYVRSTTDFYSAMELRGFKKHKTKKGIIVDGLMLVEGREFLN